MGLSTMSVADFAQACMLYLSATEGSVTSWKRSAAHNKAIGADARSPHLAGLGLDVIYTHTRPLDMRVDLATRVGLKLIARDGYDHLQPLDWNAGTAS